MVGAGDLTERGHHLVEICLSDADSGVANLDLQPSCRCFGAQRNGAAGFSELDGVRQQIDQHLQQLLLVRLDRLKSELRVDIDDDVETALRRAICQPSHRLCENFRQLHRSYFWGDYPGFRLREIENIRDHFEQVVG